MIFKNRRYFTKQTFEIKMTSLKVEARGLFDAIEYEIAHEQIDNKKTVQTSINHGFLVISIFFFVFALLFLVGTNEELTAVFFFLSVLCTVIAFVSRKSVVTLNLYDGGKIHLYFTRQNKGQVIAFSDEIIEASNKYLLNKYTRIDAALPIEPQLSGIQFLRNREIISEQDFESLKNKLIGRSNKSSIGFGS